MAEINTTEFARELFTLFTEQFSWAFIFIQALGVLVVIYLVFKVIGMILEHKKRMRIKRIETKVDVLNQKIDLVLTRLKKEKKKK